VASRDDTIAGHGFSPDADGSAREAPDTGPDVAASTKQNLNTSRAAGPLVDLVKGQTPLPASPNCRAAPPPEATAKAIEIARTHAGKSNCHFVVGERGARRLLDLFWPRHMERVYRCHSERERAFTLRDWQSGFKDALDREYGGRQRFRERRRKWERDRERSKQQRQYELAVTGGRPPPPVKIKPPRRIGPPRSKLVPGCRYLTVESLAAYDARRAQSDRASAVIAAQDARRRERAQRGWRLSRLAPENRTLTEGAR
jgi:hypothetical protein